MARPQLIVGIDVGTTSVKAVAFDAAGAAHGDGEAAYPLREPEAGRAEQDPRAVLAATVAATRAAVTAAGAERVAGLAVSTAMHGLIGLDEHDEPLTPLITWADRRAAPQARRLAAEYPELHARTGTPAHPMAPLPKLMWLAEHERAVHARTRRWIGLKELVLHRLTGEWALDVSSASGTGLLDSARLAWDPEALALAGITPAQLCPLVPATACLELCGAEVGLPPRTPVIAGGGDGPMASLGLGAVTPGTAACSIGTSGALRLTVAEPGVDRARRLFNYALTPGHWVLGGAINNGGSVLPWLAAALGMTGAAQPEGELLALAAQAPAGSEGLIMLPYLLGERAPRWDVDASGAYVGLRHRHGREHLARAGIEGVCQQLALVLESLTAAGHDVREIRATGGFARSPWWRQLLADVLGSPVGYAIGPQGSALGAAVLGFAALGAIDSIDDAHALVAIAERHEPDPAAAALYAELRPVFAALSDDLAPALHALARLHG